MYQREKNKEMIETDGVARRSRATICRAPRSHDE
jgi:hypothetical protein